MISRCSSRAAVGVAAALLMTLNACHPARDSNDADQAVALFHQRLTSGLDEIIYDESAPEFQRSVDRETVHKWFARIRRKMGAPGVSRRIVYRVTYSSDGIHANASYVTKYSNGEAHETFTWGITGGKALLVGFLLQSNAMLTD